MDLETSQRRKSTRRPGLWVGRYRLGRLRRWTDCRVVDVSMGGVAIEIDPEVDVTGRLLTLELRPVGVALDPLIVRAHVRHARRTESGSWRVGLEFDEMPPAERAALDRMIRLFAT
mgnify:CR=1 FL=1